MFKMEFLTIFSALILCCICNSSAEINCDNDKNSLKSEETPEINSLFKNPDIVNKLPALIKQDEEREAFLFADYHHSQVVDRFYQIVSQPLQTHCTFSKRIGGEWLRSCGFFDGDKFVCFDKMFADMKSDRCLVYSFGIADDWSFEDTMAGMGCRVRAFDPTIDAPEKRSELVSFHKYGLGHFNGMTQVKINNDNNREILAPVKTLQEIIKEFGEEDQEISYLKVDVEGSELKSMRGWIESGVLKNVRQIGIELHTGPVHLPSEKQTGMLAELIRVFRDLHKHGFRLVSYNPNGCVGKNQDPKKKYYTYFDVVFYRKD